MGAYREFRDRFLSLARTYPTLARGGLTASQLTDLAKRLGKRLGFHISIVYRPWPWPASIQRIGTTIVIMVDDRRHPADQVMSLAHEVGHLALGHYHLEPFWTNVDGPLRREEEAFAELFAAIVLDKRTSPLAHLGRDQLELL